MKSKADLEEAFARDSRAYVKLLAYARQAEAEGHELAHLFRAAARSRKMYVDSFLEAAGLVRSPEENLETARQSDVYDVDELYPDYIETARKEEEGGLKHIFIRARSVKMKSIALYEAARAHLGSDALADYYLCTGCGHLHQGNEAVDCPVCGKGPDTWERM